MAQLEDQALGTDPNPDTASLLDTLLAALSPSEAGAATRPRTARPPTSRPGMEPGQVRTSKSTSGDKATSSDPYSPLNPGKTAAEKADYSRYGLSPGGPSGSILTKALLDASQGAGSGAGDKQWLPAEQENQRRIDQQGGVYKDEKGNYVQRPNFQTRPEPIITNLAQLGEVLKHLSGAPDELKTHLLSQWTGIDLTSAKVQQLQNTITAAKAKFDAAAPQRAEQQKQHLETLKSRNDATQAHLDMGHQSAIRNIQGAMAKTQDTMSKTAPGMPQYQQAYETYIELNKQYKKMTGIDLAAKVEEGVKAAGKGAQQPADSGQSGNQSGITVTRLDQ
jgi:hypothetical protein